MKMKEVNNMVSGKYTGGVLTVSVTGKIDSANADAVENEINELRKNEHVALVIDFENLEYISSAGLRVILRLKRSEKDMKVANVSNDVYDIFEMTGFTEMMPVEKAYRRISLDGSERVAEGAKGIVYRINADTMVKVFKDDNCLPLILQERNLARRAFVLGIPTAISYDVVKVGDKFGSVFEMLNAEPLSKFIREDPEHLDKYAELFADLLKKIHSTVVETSDIPSAKPWLDNMVKTAKTYLPSDISAKIEHLVSELPEPHTMLHCDYHTNNIMLQNGEALLIDMDKVSYGHPVIEFACMALGFVIFGELDHSVTEKFLTYSYETGLEFWHKAVKRYLGTDDDNFAHSVEDKAYAVGYIRYLSHVLKRHSHDSKEGKDAIEFCSKRLEDVLSRVETLDF